MYAILAYVLERSGYKEIKPDRPMYTVARKATIKSMRKTITDHMGYLRRKFKRNPNVNNWENGADEEEEEI